MANTNGGSKPTATDARPKRILKYTFSAIIGGVLTAIGAAVLTVITSSYIEISFRDYARIKSWSEWPDFQVDVTKPKTFHAYFADNDNGKTALREKSFSLKYFQLTKKILGTSEHFDDHAKFTVNGFWKDEHMVLAHRGEEGGGQGVYVLKLFPVPGISGIVLSGYSVHEDWKFDSSREDWIIKCPILMVEEEVAKHRYSDKATVLRDFPYMKTKCVEFIMPTSMTKVITEGKSVDEVLSSGSNQ